MCKNCEQELKKLKEKLDKQKRDKEVQDHYAKFKRGDIPYPHF